MKLSLFAKFFAVFWLTTIAVAIAVAWSTWQLITVSRGLGGDRPDGANTALVEAANAVYATRGLEGLGEWIGRLNQQRLRHGPVLLVDAKGRVLAGPAEFEHLPPPREDGAAGAPPPALRAPPPDLDGPGLDPPRDEGRGPGPRAFERVRSYRLDTGSGDPLWLARLERPPPPPGFFPVEGPRGPRGPHEPMFGLVRMGVALSVSGLLCWLLARHLTRPIRELQAASARLAAGDFTTGLTPRTLARRDELAALARDFQSMAAQLKQLVEAQRQLLRNVSHELRSPLARLQVAAALARRRAGGVVDSEIDRIELETARLDELIGQLLALMRLEAAAGQAHAPLDLSALLEAVTRDARFEAEARGSRVEAKIERGLGLNGNAELLRSVFDNVLRNAIRHTPRGTAVQLEATRDQARRQILVSLRDEGPGVPEAMLERIFEAFVRVDEARSSEAGGSGLGLAIAKQGVRAHGGSILARNRPGGGLEVEIRLGAAGV
ncbi:MAG TPA: ATP-binding protein [Gammaproteobacteria bacterium]|nr:ATP-binding protein [Gammaproteobacteria bacterium]